MFVATGAKESIMNKRRERFHSDFVLKLLDEFHKLKLTAEDISWVIWLFFIVAIPISMSIEALRHKVSAGFITLLFNDSLLQGFALNLLLSCVFLIGGWLLTSRRAFY
jgi:hypothetical protein